MVLRLLRGERRVGWGRLLFEVVVGEGCEGFWARDMRGELRNLGLEGDEG